MESWTWGGLLRNNISRTGGPVPSVGVRVHRSSAGPTMGPTTGTAVSY